MDGPDLESPSLSIPCSYSPLPGTGDQYGPSSTLPTPPSPPPHRRPLRWLLVALSAVLLLGSAAVVFYQPRSGSEPASPSDGRAPVSRGAAEGVSEKSTASLLADSAVYPWTNVMLQWQRTSYHFQPQENWMNDPDGPMYYKGWYHLFYQYNPDSAVWGNISWGHAVSQDLLHWLHLPIAMVPDSWYDAGGVWTGSATLLPSGEVVMLYTGSTNESVQVQNLAVPADPSDPFLLEWVKSESNPVLFPPPGIVPKDFRDPTTAWLAESDSYWRVGIGSKDSDHNGIAIIYKTKDFFNYELIPGYLHSVAGTGMWECLDFYPLSTTKSVGLDTSAGPGEGVRHVLKASLDDDKHDYYAIGLYDEEGNEWTPDDPELDVGIGLRYDYGKYYASKTFYDPVKRRRILWGWTGETDSERADLLKGWASVQTIPRTVLFDTKTASNLLQWPVEEIESLRISSQNFTSVSIAAGSVVPLGISKATQLDILAEFEIEASALARAVEADVGYNCSTSGGAAGRGLLGPFGLLVLADEGLSEQLAVYFYIGRGTDGNVRTFFCQDELRSSKANDIVMRVYGSTVPVLDGESLSMRILVDHSMVESFAQGGRTCITSRVYPTGAIYSAATVFLFNNATSSQVTAKSLTVWQMNSTFIRPYPLQSTS